MKYLPLYYENSKVVNSIQYANANEIGVFNYKGHDTINQHFLKTATWALKDWEEEYGIVTDISKPYELRREIVLAKIRGSGTTTKAMIQNVSRAFSGGEVKVNEYPSEYRFEIQFIGIKGIPQNMAGLIKAIDDIKPAHLSYCFKYTYTVWNMLDFNWEQADSRTWNELKVYE
jgi:hypothetical protein